MWSHVWHPHTERGVEHYTVVCAPAMWDIPWRNLLTPGPHKTQSILVTQGTCIPHSCREHVAVDSGSLILGGGHRGPPASLCSHAHQRSDTQPQSTMSPFMDTSCNINCWVVNSKPTTNSSVTQAWRTLLEHTHSFRGRILAFLRLGTPGSTSVLCR